MQRNAVAQMALICAGGGEGCGTSAPSEKANPAEADEVPVFVSRAVALGYDPAESWALYRRLIQTGADIRARRITPAGGLRRAERLALAVAIAKVAL